MTSLEAAVLGGPGGSCDDVAVSRVDVDVDGGGGLPDVTGTAGLMVVFLKCETNLELSEGELVVRFNGGTTGGINETRCAGGVGGGADEVEAVLCGESNVSARSL